MYSPNRQSHELSLQRKAAYNNNDTGKKMETKWSLLSYQTYFSELEATDFYLFFLDNGKTL